MRCSRGGPMARCGSVQMAPVMPHMGASGDEARPDVLAIPQVVQQGQVDERPLLPSFLYLPGANELPAGSLKLPWNEKLDYAAGEFARTFGSQVPTRLVASAKRRRAVSINRRTKR